MLPYNKTLKHFSRNLRNNMTRAERLLWARLRYQQILGMHFYRQKPIAGFIADFYCATAKLVIELDGSQHFDEPQQAQDKARDKIMESLGLLILRFDNRQIITNMDCIMAIIFEVVSARTKEDS
jgi:very-short-patch-repair endonuclease